MKSKPNDKIFLYGTVLVLLFGLVILIGITFMLSSGFPSLFGKCVAVVNINQEIVTEGMGTSLFSEGIAGSEDIAVMVKDLEERDDVGAVLFVVNSPGGSVVATHEVYDAIENVSKPKVAYFREVAASGGYYIAMGTDYIISDPDALTGSIGVITTVTDMSGVMDKLGVNISAVKSGAHKDIGSPYRSMDEEEAEIFNNIIQEIFGEFKAVILKSRGNKLDMELFEKVLDGRVLTGRQALEIGLVDAIGRKQDAINKAAELAGIPQEEVKLCEIDLVQSEGSLFNMKALAGFFESSRHKVEISYE